MKLRFAQAEVVAVLVQSVITPAIAETESVHDSSKKSRRPSRAVALFRLHKHGRRSGVLLDVVDVVTEALESDEIMDVLPDHTRHRDFCHHPEQHDLLSGGYVHVLVSAISVTAAGKNERRSRCAVWSSNSCLYKPSTAIRSSCLPR